LLILKAVKGSSVCLSVTNHQYCTETAEWVKLVFDTEACKRILVPRHIRLLLQAL